MNKDSYMLGKEVSGKIKSLLLEDVKKLTLRRCNADIRHIDFIFSAYPW